jgi:hypothetical protein
MELILLLANDFPFSADSDSFCNIEEVGESGVGGSFEAPVSGRSCPTDEDGSSSGGHGGVRVSCLPCFTMTIEPDDPEELRDISGSRTCPHWDCAMSFSRLGLS